jgi:hypothetical protein
VGLRGDRVREPVGRDPGFFLGSATLEREEELGRGKEARRVGGGPPDADDCFSTFFSLEAGRHGNGVGRRVEGGGHANGTGWIR